MSDREKEKKNSEQNGSPDKRDESNYRFMDQMIKKRPVERKPVLFRILSVVGAGVAIGLIASLVLTLTQPALRESLSEIRHSGKVTIPPDESEAGDNQAAEQAAETGSTYSSDHSEPEVGEDISTDPETEAAVQGETKESALSSMQENNPHSETEPGEQAGGKSAEEDNSFTGQSREAEIVTDSVQQDANVESRDGSDQTGEGELSGETGQGDAESASSAHLQEDTQQSAGDDPEGSAGGPEGKEELTEPGQTDETGSEEPETDQVSESITLKEYRQLYRDMMEVAEIPEHSLVQVIGITREMDYFNQNYENQRQISGLIVATTDSDLYILTEYRVVDKVERIQVVFCNGTMTDVTFQKADPGTGLAILKVPLDNIGEETRSELVTAPLGNSYKVSRGEPVLALGSPLGFPGSIAYGIVTSNSTNATVADAEYPLLTTDIDGSADGSGILVDLDGEIVGFITSSFGNSTGGITGLGISRLKKLIEDLSNNESRNYVGILGQEVTQDITDRTGIPRGLLVTEVEQDSPAMLGGIKEYDVIVKIGDQSVDSMRNYQKVIQGLEADETVLFKAMRRGAEGFAEINFEITIESQ